MSLNALECKFGNWSLYHVVSTVILFKASEFHSPSFATCSRPHSGSKSSFRKCIQTPDNANYPTLPQSDPREYQWPFSSKGRHFVAIVNEAWRPRDVVAWNQGIKMNQEHQAMQMKVPKYFRWQGRTLPPASAVQASDPSNSPKISYKHMHVYEIALAASRFLKDIYPKPLEQLGLTQCSLAHANAKEHFHTVCISSIPLLSGNLRDEKRWKKNRSQRSRNSISSHEKGGKKLPDGKARIGS